MKKVDVAGRVMKKVITFERERTAIWLRSFAVVVSALVLSCAVVFWLVIKDLLEKRAFDIFELFTQEPEIISEFWKEVLETFWDELPQDLVFIISMIFGALCIFMIITKRKRMIIEKRLRQLEKYK